MTQSDKNAVLEAAAGMLPAFYRERHEKATGPAEKQEKRGTDNMSLTQSDKNAVLEAAAGMLPAFYRERHEKKVESP